MKIMLHAGMFVVMMLGGSLATAPPAGAAIEWTVTKQLTVDAPLLDVTTSPDGKWMIGLAPGEILVYSMNEGKVISRTAVDKAFDKLTYSAADQTVIVTSTKEKRLQFIQLDVVNQFSYAGSPFKGPENARVVMAVFSDYQ